MVEVSVILPVYNDQIFLAHSIESVLNQSYQDFELIIVDDGSSSWTKKVINTFKKNEKIVLTTLKRNVGVANARNIGIKVARGNYIAFIDSDDEWEKNKLKFQMQFMKKNNISFSYSYYNIIDENSRIVNQINFLPSKVSYRLLKHSNFIPMLTVIIKKEYLLSQPFCNVHHEDYATWLLILKKFQLCAILVPARLASYRVHSGSVSSNKLRSLSWSWNIYRNILNASLIMSSYYLITNAFWGLLKHRHSLSNLWRSGKK